MSGPAGDSRDSLLQRYSVGYRRPPAEHRFRKGQSGNPGGRPKGAKNRPKVDNGFGMRGAEEYLRHEAYRPVRIREGDELIELPAIQAVFRAMGVAAMKGNRFAQKTLSELVTGLEQRDADARLELFGAAFDYKQSWSERIAHGKERGLPVPEPIPHPEDIELDPSTGGVKFLGPWTEEQKVHYDWAMEVRSESQRDVSRAAKAWRTENDPAKQDRLLEDWHCYQRHFDTINDALGPRYQAKLKDRSWKEGATRPGAICEKRKASS